ncbi:hypothetical protein [Corynebacterium sp. Marseille-P3884]|uniref:hypothetical protein n=1 Tax=Corynebacterium sp. Marseille-P3884 TaxID=2495409 RepID=UPI001B33801D|nr:hypothetical protein [Corynebacterium sp. Marseille-P3884]MBP3949036.1 hypothetical protein [Corynebacterium sp. Marseille-P3884]
MTTSIDYVRWIGIAAWTSGLAISRNCQALAVLPGDSPGRILIQSAGGRATAFEDIEREYTHIQWLLAGAPSDESVLDYVYHQQLCLTHYEDIDHDFAILDVSDSACESKTYSFRDRRPDYSPKAALAAAQRLSNSAIGSALSEHIPAWSMAESLGLLALAVREYFTGEVVRELTRKYVKDLCSDSLNTQEVLGCGRLAYSVAFKVNDDSATTAPVIALHVQEDDPLFTESVLRHILGRAQAFASACGSGVHCGSVFHNIIFHQTFPSTVHEPDAEETPIILYRIPLSTDLLPVQSLTQVLGDDALTEPPQRTSLSIRRLPDSGIIRVRSFIPGTSIVDRAIHRGGYLASSELVSKLQQEKAMADPDCLAAAVTSALIWESLNTWGLASGSTASSCSVLSVRANSISAVEGSIHQPLLTVEVDAQAPLGTVAHDVCDVLGDLGIDSFTDFPIELLWSDPPKEAGVSASSPNAVRPQATSLELPVLWPRALGARSIAATNQALALAAVRRALRHCCTKGLSWIGVAHARTTSASGRHQIRVAVAFESEYADRVAVYQELSLAVNAVFAENSIGPHVTCEVIDANQITDVSAWVTAAGYHPVTGFLPAFIQLEHLNTGCALNS